METMHAAGRRRLPPVPRSAGSRPADGQLIAQRPSPEPIDAELSETQVIDTRQIAAELIEAELTAADAAEAAAAAAAEATEAELTGDEPTEDEPTEDEPTEDEPTEDEPTEDAPIEAAPIEAAPTEDEPTEDEPTEDEPTAPTAGADPVDDLDHAGCATATDDTEKFHMPDLCAAEAPEQPSAGVDDSDVDEGAAADLSDDPADASPEAHDPPQKPSVPRPRSEPAVDAQDPAQQFVARLRSSAADFASAAGADSAVVREAVPPARHRRARCRLVLRYEGGDVADVTLLGPVGVPGRPSRHGFDRQILRWLGTGLLRDGAWLVDDPDAPDGVAVDLSAWVAAG